MYLFPRCKERTGPVNYENVFGLDFMVGQAFERKVLLFVLCIEI